MIANAAEARNVKIYLAGKQAVVKITKDYHVVQHNEHTKQ